MEEIKKIIKEIFKCRHKNAILNRSEGYCPDCGKYVKKSYYILRCSCCGIKRSAKKMFEEIVPAEKFCTNCGAQEFVVEKCEKLNIVDINYAVETKEAMDETADKNEFEIWVENNSHPYKNADDTPDKTSTQGETPKIKQVPYQIPLLS